MKKLIVILLYLNTSYLILAKNHQITIRDVNLKVLMLPQWQKVEGFLGGDITFIAPETTGPRPVIKLDVVNKKSWNFEDEKKSLPKYLKNKKEWLTSKEGKLTYHKLGLTSKSMSAPHLYNTVRYTIDNQFYEEQDWLIKCPSALINLSLLVTPERFTNLKSTWDNFISSFKCL